MPLRLDMRPTGDLDDATTRGLLALLRDSFDGVKECDFRRDLAEKDTVMLLTDAASGRTVGFSTLMHFRLRTPEREVMVVFSGDTAVAPDERSFWGFGYGLDVYFRRVREAAGALPAYYVLISKGWRTYRVMGFLFRRFFPAPAAAPSPADRAIASAFGEQRYPGRFDERRGVIAGGPDGVRIRPGGPDEIAPHRLADPLVRFFAETNPSHDRGDELVCVASVDPANYTAAFERMCARYAAAPARPC